MSALPVEWPVLDDAGVVTFPGRQVAQSCVPQMTRGVMVVRAGAVGPGSRSLRLVLAEAGLDLPVQGRVVALAEGLGVVTFAPVPEETLSPLRQAPAPSPGWDPGSSWQKLVPSGSTPVGMPVTTPMPGSAPIAQPPPPPTDGKDHQEISSPDLSFQSVHAGSFSDLLTLGTPSAPSAAEGEPGSFMDLLAPSDARAGQQTLDDFDSPPAPPAPQKASAREGQETMEDFDIDEPSHPVGILSAPKPPADAGSASGQKGAASWSDQVPDERPAITKDGDLTFPEATILMAYLVGEADRGTVKARPVGPPPAVGLLLEVCVRVEGQTSETRVEGRVTQAEPNEVVIAWADPPAARQALEAFIITLES